MALGAQQGNAPRSKWLQGGRIRAESSSRVGLSQRHPALLTRVVGSQQPGELLGGWTGMVTGESSRDAQSALLKLPWVTTQSMGPR